MPFRSQQTKIKVHHMKLLAAAPRSSAVRLQISDNLPAKWRNPVISTTLCNVFKGGTQTDTDVEDLRQWLNWYPKSPSRQIQRQYRAGRRDSYRLPHLSRA
jgi:hypothetical protein